MPARDRNRLIDHHEESCSANPPSSTTICQVFSFGVTLRGQRGKGDVDRMRGSLLSLVLWTNRSGIFQGYHSGRGWLDDHIPTFNDAHPHPTACRQSVSYVLVGYGSTELVWSQDIRIPTSGVWRLAVDGKIDPSWGLDPRRYVTEPLALYVAWLVCCY